MMDSTPFALYFTQRYNFLNAALSIWRTKFAPTEVDYYKNSTENGFNELK